MLTRLNRLNAIFKTLAIAVPIAGGVVGLLIALNVIGGDTLVPVIESIRTIPVTASSPPEVIAGKEVDVIGKNLDSVARVFLGSGLAQSPIPVFLIPDSKTRLVITIPSSVQPGEYNLEFEDNEGNAVATVRTKVVREKTPTPRPTVIFPEFVWRFERRGDHNVIDAGDKNFEKFSVGEDESGVYFSINQDSLGDFLVLEDTNTFFGELGSDPLHGEWEIIDENIVLTPSN